MASIVVVVSAIEYRPEKLHIYMDDDMDRSLINNHSDYEEDIETYTTTIAEIFYKSLCVINLIPAFVFLVPVCYLLGQQGGRYIRNLFRYKR